MVELQRAFEPTVGVSVAKVSMITISFNLGWLLGKVILLVIM